MQVVVCQEADRDEEGAEVAGMLAGITSQGRLMLFVSLEDAAEQLSRPGIVAVLDLPEEEGWEAAREMPAVMKTKFLRLLMQSKGKH
jgi:hypothetical protein